MRTANEWFTDYGVSHRHPTNELLHWICVPVIVISSLGLLWALPAPVVFARISPWLNWSSLVALAALIYYLSLSPRLGLGMLPVLAAMLLIVRGLDALPVQLWVSCVTLFVLAWVGQFIGHAIEGKKPSFMKDLQFLLIGPLWLLGHIYRRIGLLY